MPGAEHAAGPTPRERDSAARLLDTALEEGQLDSEEHLARLRVVLDATETREVEGVLVDLQWPPPTRRDRLRAAWVGTPRRERIATAITGLVILGLLVVGTVVSSEQVDEDSYAAIGEQDQTSAERISAFTRAYEDRFGTTMTGGVQLDDVVDQVRVPVDGAARRYETWYLQNDAFNHYGSVSSGEPQVDLAAVDGAAAAQNLDVAWTQLGVEEPTDISIIISGPASAADQAQITYIVHNEFKESGRLVTALTGVELSRSPFEPPTRGR